MDDRQFWWATVHGNDRPEVVEVTFEGGRPAYVCEAGAPSIAADEFERCHVRLIERVLPAGRAAAVVAKLQEAIDGPGAWGPWSLTQEAIDILKGERQA